MANGRQERRGGGARRQQEFSYRGHSLEELQEMSRDELLPLLPARIRRSLERGLSEEGEKFLEKVEGAHEEEVLRTHCRDVPILPNMVGRVIAVHDGREFQRVDVEPDMIGHYLGEFAMTREEVEHTGPGIGATRSSKFMPLK